MHIGVIGYSNRSGLGNYIANFSKHLPFNSQLVIRHPDKGTFPPDIPCSYCNITAKENDLLLYLDTHKPDAVFIIETPFNDEFFSILKSRNIKIIYVPMIDCKSIDVIKPFLYYIDVVINHTKYGHDIYKKVFGGKAHYIPYPVDTEYFHPDSLTENGFSFLHNQGTGGAGYRKATDQVFIAFRQLSYVYPDVKMLVNSQPYEHIHSQLFKDVKGVTVKIQDYPESIDIYRNGKVYVAPSRREGLGLPILEAMSCGLPVITTDAPPMNEWFDDQRLLVKCVRNVSKPFELITPQVYDLFTKLLWIYDNQESLENIGKENREIVEKLYSWDVLKPRYLELLEGICT